VSSSSVTRRVLRIFPCYVRLVRDDNRYRHVGDSLPDVGAGDVGASPNPPGERVHSLGGPLDVVDASADARPAWPTGAER
jgi:hypothetical protein